MGGSLLVAVLTRTYSQSCCCVMVEEAFGMKYLCNTWFFFLFRIMCFFLRLFHGVYTASVRLQYGFSTASPGSQYGFLQEGRFRC